MITIYNLLQGERMHFSVKRKTASVYNVAHCLKGKKFNKLEFFA